MNSIKAIFAGCAFIIFVVLLMQLAYIFIAVAYNALAKDFTFLNDISSLFRYLIGIPVFIAVMFIGGYITAYIASKKVIPHCIAVGLITAGGMIYPTLENSSLTTTGIVVFVLALAGTVAGGLYWQKDNEQYRV